MTGLPLFGPQSGEDNGLVATPLAPNWAASGVVLTVIAGVTAVAATRAARRAMAPTGLGQGRG